MRWSASGKNLWCMGCCRIVLNNDFILQIIRIIQRCWSYKEDGLVDNFFLMIDGDAVAWPHCKDNLFLQIWFGTMQSKAIANVTRRETDFVPCSRRNMVTGSRMELRFGRTDQSPVRKETMAEWRLPRWSHCKLWWKLNVGTISKRKMGNLNLFDISFDFYRLPALYYF